MKSSCLSPSLLHLKPELLAEIAQALDADGGRLLLFPHHLAQRARVFSYGLQPLSSIPIEKNLLWQEIFDAHTSTIAPQPLSGVYAIESIAEYPILAPLSISFGVVGIQSLLILPLRFKQQCFGCLTLFRSTPHLTWTKDELELAKQWVIDLTLGLLQAQVEQMFEDRSYYDLLTGLPHRLLCDRWLILTLAKMPLEDRRFAVVLINLDRFKHINDSLGHSSADRLLQLIAVRLTKTLRSTAICGRWSGDEFILLISELDDIVVLREIADRVLTCFDSPFLLAENSSILYVQVRMGIVLATSGNCDSELLIKQANIALDRARNHGKNSYEIYSSFIHSSWADPVALRQDRLKLEQMLDRAIIDQKLLLHYQPQIDVQTGTIIGIEALLRCQDANFKTINPADFIPVAEETGSIIQLGEWVIEAACQQNKLWQDMGLGNFPMAVNFSVKQLQDRNLIDRILGILAVSDISPDTLEVEITESIAMQDLDLTISILQSLREIGVKISLDDFGTGYSSLAMLKYLPLDRLKIDRSFIRELKSNTIDVSIVRTIINLGHQLNLNIVAEGVETIEQFELLKSIDCDAVQGFLFSPPVPAMDLETVIITGSYWHQSLNLAHNLRSH